MLYHVTMTHTEDNCPAYNREQQVAFMAAADKLDSLAKELNVKVLQLLWGAPEHVAFAVVEADSLGAIARLVFSLPFRQEFKVTPVQHLQDVVDMTKAMMAQAQK